MISAIFSRIKENVIAAEVGTGARLENGRVKISRGGGAKLLLSRLFG
jgi:hypothetical protein